MSYSPTKVILLFFIAVIGAGALLLSLPISRTAGNDFAPINYLFTATSAVCVTGLTTVDIGKYYTLFGQIIILLLIQIGGLGYMTLSTIVGLFVGRIALKERIVLKELLDIDSFAGLLNLLKKIVAIVLLIEGIGAILLCIAFMRQYPFMSALYLGIFHSVSAFCNAGISVFSANVEGYSRSAFVLLTIAALIIVGGIGFTVLVELTEFGRKRIGRLSLHTRIVLIMTAVLIVSGLILFWLFEANNVLKDTGAGYSLLNSFFQSVTTRTAGFDSILPALYTRATSIIMIILMFIGASPGGTGGGIKTTTFFIVLLFASTMVKDRSDVVTGRRRISEDIVQKALAVFIWSIFFIVTVTTVMTLFEPGLFIDILFEVVSAFGTVGLSRGITPGLTIAGKLLIIATMIIGRVGILTFLMALLKNEKEQILVRYPEEKVMIG